MLHKYYGEGFLSLHFTNQNIVIRFFPTFILGTATLNAYTSVHSQFPGLDSFVEEINYGHFL